MPCTFCNGRAKYTFADGVSSCKECIGDAANPVAAFLRVKEELKTARKQERERCAKVCEAIRALKDEE